MPLYIRNFFKKITKHNKNTFNHKWKHNTCPPNSETSSVHHVDQSRLTCFSPFARLTSCIFLFSQPTSAFLSNPNVLHSLMHLASHCYTVHLNFCPPYFSDLSNHMSPMSQILIEEVIRRRRKISTKIWGSNLFYPFCEWDMRYLLSTLCH